MVWFTDAFRTSAFVVALVFACVLGFGQIQKIQLLTTTTHIASKSVQHPYDHYYITADSWIHPIERPTPATVLVDNTCRIWKDNTWVFCGMLPWQHNPCAWTGKNASTNFYQHIKDENYELLVGGKEHTQLVSDFVKMQRLDVTDTDSVLRKSIDTCLYENFHDLQMIRNEPDAFSVASTHSPVVLMWGAWLVLTVCYAMGGKKAFANFFADKPDIQQSVYNAFDMVFFALLLLFFFWTRFMYASNMVESGSVIVPNASFVYVFFAVAWTLFWTRSDVADNNLPSSPAAADVSSDVLAPVYLPDTAAGQASAGQASAGQWPLPRKEKMDAPMPSHTPMAIDVSNFSGTKLKTRGYMQAGVSGRYPATVSLTDVDVDLKSSIKDILVASDYELVTFESGRFYIAQLWAVPFTVLSLFLFDSGFAMDIDVTLVAVMSFLFAIIDVFVLKLRNVNGVVQKFQKDAATGHSMRYALLLVQFVLIFVECCVLWVLYYFIEPRVHETHMKRERLNAMQLFGSIHVILSAVMLLLQAVNLYDKPLFGIGGMWPVSAGVVSNAVTSHATQLQWRHLVHAVRHLNLFLFCGLAWLYVLHANQGEGHLVLNNEMHIFNGENACKQDIHSATPMPVACSLGLSFSNLYSQHSTIRFKAVESVGDRLTQAIAIQAQQLAEQMGGS